MTTPRRILIVKMSAIGDVLLTTPAARALREAFPDAHIAWAVDKRCAAVVEGNPYLDQVIVLRQERGFLAQCFHYWHDVHALPAFDWALDFQGLARSALVTRASRARLRAGFADSREMSGLSYNRRVQIPAEPPRHRVDYYAAFLEALGVPVPEREMLFPFDSAHAEEAEALLAAEAPGDGPLVVICPTAGREQKCWPAESFGALADRLIECHGCRVVVVGGAGDRPTVARMEAAMRQRPGNLAGRMGLKTLAAVLHRADLFLGADTGPMHIAAAVKTPSLALFGPTDPRLYGPYNVVHTVIRKHCRCAPNWRHPSCEHSECMRAITVAEVEAAALALLKRTTETAPALDAAPTP